MPSTEVLYNNHVVYDSILGNCNGADLLRLMRTCKAFEKMCRDFMRREYDVHKHLRRFFSNPVAFRRMQALTGAIVSGSFALQFFTRSHYPTADLDIYVCHSGGVKAGVWLQENGYTFVPGLKKERGKVCQQPSSFDHAINSMDFAWVPDDFYCKGVTGVFNFEKSVGGHDKKVQVVITEICPIRTILNFHSTCVMNFITYNRAYCLYPLETVEKSVSLVLTEYTYEVYKALLKYSDRGFTFFDNVGEGEEDFKHEEVRWVEDKWSWVMELENIGLGHGSVDPTWLTTWSILTVPKEYHRIYLHTLYGEKKDSVHPLIVATSRLMEKIKFEYADMVLRRIIKPYSIRDKDRNTAALFDGVYKIIEQGAW